MSFKQLNIKFFFITNLALTVLIPKRVCSSIHKLVIWLITCSTINVLLHSTKTTCYLWYHLVISYYYKFIKLRSSYSSSPLTQTLINFSMWSESVNLRWLFSVYPKLSDRNPRFISLWKWNTPPGWEPHLWGFFKLLRKSKHILPGYLNY